MSEQFEVLIKEDEIKERIKELAQEIKQFYKGEKLHMICVLKGAVVFFVDLARELEGMDVVFDFLGCSSYGDSTRSSGVVKITKDLDSCLEGESVLLVEDIIDTGHTLNYISRIIKERNPSKFEICTLLDKPSRREKEVYVKFKGFEIEDKFVVGYGFDWNQGYRHLKDITVVKSSN